MSELTPRLPERPSLEQLQKLSKELLRELHSNDASAVERLRAVSPQMDATEAALADAQFVIAREHGFATWARLKHHLEARTRPGLEKYEQLAKDVALAYMTGDAAAIQEMNWSRGTSFPHDRVIERMQRRLTNWFASESRSEELALTDAQRLVARNYGFETWAAFVERIRLGPRRSWPSGAKSSPPAYTIDERENTIYPGPILEDADWDPVFEVMKERQITGLNASGKMTDDAARRLSRLEHVTRLITDGSVQLTDDGVLALAGLHRLEELDLSGWKGVLTDRGFAVLRHLPALRHFRICWQQNVTDAGMAHLAACEHLELVNLMGSPTGDGAIQSLAGKSKLRRLSTGRLVTDAGVVSLQQIPIFATWHGGEPDYHLMRFEGEPNQLLLDGPFTNEGLGALTRLEGLAGLNFFWHCENFSAAGLKHLAHLPNLGFLGCDGKYCDDEAMGFIAAIPGLHMLMCQGTIATDEGFRALSRSQNLEFIWGRECPNLTGKGFAALAEMPALAGLAVSCANVDEAALATLPRFAALRQLVPMDVPEEGFRHVGQCQKLEKLWCMYCRDTGDAATEHLAGLSKLKFYYAGSTRITDRSLEMLGRMASLEELHFSYCPAITNSGVAHLAGLPRLRELTLDGLMNVTRDVAAKFPAHVQVKYSS